MTTQLLTSDQRPQLLDTIPPPEAIRRQIVNRIEEGRLLRSLYRLSQRIAQAKQQADLVNASHPQS